MNYLKEILNPEHLERLAFFKDYDYDYWSDIDSKVLIYELINGDGYQQFVWDTLMQEKFSFDKPIKTVDDLIKRYKSETGYDARYYTGDLPQTGQ